MKKYCLDGEIAAFDYHDDAGLWSFCGPKSLKAFLARCKDGEQVEIEINSPGGSVVYGVEMANLIKNSGARVTAHVTGIAASMASVIACACDEIVMEEASFMMIHDPWGATEGNADEMRKEAKLLDQMKAVIMSFYRGKFEGKSDDEISALMSDETWYTGNECLANGLKCTVVKSDMQIAAKVGVRNFAKMPDAVKALYNFAAMPDDVKAAVEAAKKEAAEDGQVATAPQRAVDGADDWEARYKGASKKITELTNKLADVSDTAKAKLDDMAAKFEAAKESVKNRDEKIAELQAKVEKAAVETVDYGKACADRDEAIKTINDFNDQVKNAGFENLAALIGAVSGLRADLEKSGKDLAESREQLDHLKATRDILTAGVLNAPDEANSYKAKMAAAKTAEERENLRALKKAGKIK